MDSIKCTSPNQVSSSPRLLPRESYKTGRSFCLNSVSCWILRTTTHVRWGDTVKFKIIGFTVLMMTENMSPYIHYYLSVANETLNLFSRCNTISLQNVNINIMYRICKHDTAGDIKILVDIGLKYIFWQNWQALKMDEIECCYICRCFSHSAGNFCPHSKHVWHTMMARDKH